MTKSSTGKLYSQGGKPSTLSFSITMRAIVKLFGGLKEKGDFNKNNQGDIIFEFKEPCTIKNLIDSLRLNKKPYLIIKNGILINDLETEVKDGDEIGLFPPIAGGSKH